MFFVARFVLSTPTRFLQKLLPISHKSTLPEDSNYPFFRANPFPEVTDLICRIPLSTLFYRPEAANLGDLMRLLVRTGEQIIISPGFSLTVMDAPDNSKSELLFLV